MPTTPATIDLDGPRPDPSPAATRANRLPDRVTRRRIALAATALLLLTATAAAPPRPGLEPHFTLPWGTSVMLGEDLLYVHDSPTDNEPGTVTGYRLADGTPQWTVPGEEAMFGPYEVGTTVLFGSFGPARSTIGPARAVTVARDRRTGDERWRRPGHPVLTGDPDLMFLSVPSDPDPDPDSGRRPVGYDVIMAVDPVTGRVGWRSPPGHWINPGSDPDLLVRMVDDRLVTYDPRTGRQLASGGPVTTTTTGSTYVGAIGDLLLVIQSDRGVTGYDPETLAPRWTNPAIAGWGAGDCGPVVCIFDEEEQRVLDPATGRDAWQADWRADRLPPDDRSGPWRHYPGLPGLLLVNQRLLDAATGAPVRDLAADGWEDRAGGGGSLWLTGDEVPALVRVDRHGPARADTRSWVGVLRADPVRVQPVGVVDGFLGECVTDGDHVACRQAGEVHVWRVPAG